MPCPNTNLHKYPNIYYTTLTLFLLQCSKNNPNFKCLYRLKIPQIPTNFAEIKKESSLLGGKGSKCGDFCVGLEIPKYGFINVKFGTTDRFGPSDLWGKK